MMKGNSNKKVFTFIKFLIVIVIIRQNFWVLKK